MSPSAPQSPRCQLVARAGAAVVRASLAVAALGLLNPVAFAQPAPPPIAADTGADALAREILDHVDDLFRGQASHGRARMSVTTEHWQRSLELEFWSKGKERSLIRITAPKKEQDTATLRSGNDLWNFLPKVKRVVKLPSSMLGASWMGSHFSNDDLVKDSRMADDYALSVSFRGVRDGVDVIEVTGLPHPDAAVVWGKVVVEVLAADRMPRSIRYYDEQMKLARTLTYHDVAAMGGRRLPTRMSMQPADKTAESTEVVWLEIAFDVDLADEMFSLRTLQQ